MSKALRSLLNRASNVICGIGCVFCALALLPLAPLFAEDAAPAPEAGEASPEAAVSPADQARDLAKRRSELAKAYRQAHIDYMKARNEAASQDPEIGRMEKRAAALEAEAKRVRAEIESRMATLPAVSSAKSELDAAQEMIGEINRQFQSPGTSGMRQIRRKPSAVPASVPGDADAERPCTDAGSSTK